MNTPLYAGSNNHIGNQGTSQLGGLTEDQIHSPSVEFSPEEKKDSYWDCRFQSTLSGYLIHILIFRAWLLAC